MTLIEKVQELQAIQPPLDPTEMKRRIEEWKTSTNYKDPNARKEAKGDTAVAEKDTTVTAETTEVSEPLDSGDGELVFQDDYGLSISPIKGLSNKTSGFGTSEFFKDVIYNMQLEEYDKAKKDFESKKQAQKEGIDILESGEVNFESRVIIPRGEVGFDEFTFNEIKTKIDNKEPGFENAKDVKDYVSKVPNAEIITYTQGKDFEGTVGTIDEVEIQKYDPIELNNQLGNKVWETNNEPAIQASLDEYGNSVGSNYFPTIKNSREAEKEKNDGSKAVNIYSAQNYRTDYLGSQANLQFNDVSIDDVLQDGKQFLTKNELKFLELSPEEQDKEASKENYGERLFFGDEIKNLDLDKVQESEIELFQKAKKLADTTEKDVLKQKLNNDYFKIVGLAQEIYNWDKANSGAANDPSFFSKNGGYKDQKGFEWTEDISSLVEEIALNGRLPGYLEKLDVRAIDDEDGHPLIKAFNDAVENYKIVNRAFQLDRDPLTTKQGGFAGFGEEFKNKTLELLGSSPGLTDRQTKNKYLNWAQSNGFTASKSALDNSLAIQIPGVGLQAPESFGQEIGATAPDLLAWMGDVYLFTRGSGNIVGKTQKWANKLATQSKRFSKIPYALPAFKTANAALGQAVTFTGGSIVGQYRTGDFDLESLPSSAGFGASLAVGHSMYDPFVKFLGKSKMGRMFSPVVNALTKYTPNTYKRVSRSVGGGFGGATTYQFGGAVTGGLFDEQGNLTVSLHTQAVETIKMIIAGTFTKAIPNMRSIGKEFKSDIISAKTSGRLDLEAKESAQRLGVKVKEGGLLEKEGFEVDQENAQAELNDAFENKVNDLLKRKREGKITKEEADAEFKRLKEDYRVVDTQIAVNAAYELIQAEKNSGNAPRESEFYLVSQKIKNGEKLNDRDGEVLSYYGLDGVGMLYKRLGIQKNSVNDSYLQNLILNESLIEAQLNGKSFMLTPYGLQPLNPVEFVSPKGTTARQNAREFLLKKQELNERIYRLKNLDKTNLSESELLENKEAIKSAEQELSKYIKGGELYNNIQSELQGAAITAYEKDIKQADPSEGVVVEAKTPEEFQQRYDESGFKAEDVKGKIAFTDKDGNKVINREFALQQRNFTPVTHEIPHSILKDSFKDAEGNVTPEGIDMIDGVLDKLTPRQKQVLDEELASRYDVGQSKEKWYEENITVLAELIKRGEIEFNKSFGEGLAGLVPAFKKFLPNIEVNPETGKGIFDMLKAQDLSRVKIKETPKKVEVETTTENLELAAPSASFSLSKNNSNTVNKLFEEKGKEASFEILELLRPTAVALARRFKNRPGYDEQLLVDEIMTGKRGMLDVINDYAAKVEKGEKVGDLSLFLNNSFSTKTGFKRYIEIADRNLGKEFDSSVDDLAGLKDVAVEEATKEKEKVTATKRLPSEVKMKPEFVENLDIKLKEGQTPEQAIQEALKTQVLDSFKDIDINKYKDLKTPRSLAEFYAKMLGIESEAGIKALMIPNRNFPAGEKAAATRAKQFILDNLQAIHSRINTPGFKQTKVGKALLNEKGDLKAGSLKTLRDIISGKNITVEGYDGKPIEFNPLENGKPVPLYRRSQPLKVVLASYFKNNALEYLKTDKSDRVQLGAKFSESKITTELDKKLTESRVEKEFVKGIKASIQEIITKAIPGKLGAFDLSTIESRQEAVRFMETEFFPKMFEVFGVDAEVLLKSKELAPSGNNIISYKPGKKVQKIGGAFGRDQLGVTDANKASKEIKLNKELAETGVVYQVKNILQAYKNLGLTGEKSNAILTALKTQLTKDLDSNIKNRETHKKGYKDFLNLFKKLYDSDPKMMRGIGFLMYNPGANFAFYRNLAQLIGVQKGVKKGREEHVYQAGNWAKRTLEAMSSKDPKAWDNWLEWSKEYYYQETIEGKNKDKTSSESVVDGIYKENRYSDVNPEPTWLPKLPDGLVYESQSMEHPVLKTALDKAIKTGDFSKVPDPKIRYYNEYLSLNPNLLGNMGMTDAKRYNVEVPKKFELNPNIYKYQGQLIYQQILTKAGILTGENALTSSKAKKLIDEKLKSVEPEAKQATANNELIGKNLKIDISKIEASDAEVVTNELKTADAALELSRSLNIKNGKPVEKEKRKIRIFDFDDTLARSNSKVLVEMPDGKTFKINATQFAERAAELEKDGADFDFSEFSKVVEGRKGPLFKVAKKIADARGTEDLFVLTARPQDAAGPIKEFLKALGIDIPLKNITGLADGKASAKGRWVMSKVAEGYNDFYFADDALKNVQAVKEVLDQADVKGKVQQAKFSKAKTFNTITNEMIEASSGIESFKTFSAAKARTLGENKGRFDWLTLASSAEDFKGLLYKMIGKGKQGEAHFEFLKTNLIDSYNRAEDSVIQAKIAAANDFMALKSMYKTIPTTLKKETGVGKFTYQHALRTYMWTKQGMSIPGLSKADATKLNKFVTDSPELQTFADQLIVSQKGKGYPEPGKDWLAGNLTTDIIGGINKVNRAEYQKTFRENVDIIFSPENLNKMEAAYGTRWRKALENSLKRMKAGTNRLGYNDSSSAILDWVNNSVGAVMFLNTRSALLQTISAVNFLNWGDNNIIKAGQAFANQKQYWSDFMTLMNSDFLVQRRNGLKINVSESEIADAVKDSQNKPKAAIAYLLSKGFVFTRYADSFAIASGGSTFYRNRIKKYLKEGLDQKLAEQKAFEDFKDVAEESQQSSDPSKISMQQASGAGRVILNWANTPMQYMRIQKRDLQDLIARRGDPKVKIARIAYYGVVQNLIFNALQQALFAVGFGDDDEGDEKKKKAKDKKIARVANGMIDSQLKGLGISGMVMLSAKNTLMKIYEESKQERPEYEAAAIEALSFSPAISSKYRKFVGGLKSFSWNMEEIKEKGFSLDNPAYLAGAQIFTAFTNLPIDRVMKKVNNIRGILSEQSQMWQKVSMALGWSSYDVGLPYYGGWDKPVEPTEEEIKKQEFDKLKKDTKTQDQIDMLLDFGLTKKEIRALGKEDDRVKKIIELQNAEVKIDGEKVEVVKPKETNEEKLKRQFDSIKAKNKPDQVKTLTKFGLSKKQIRNLKYEKDRVEKILELINK